MLKPTPGSFDVLWATQTSPMRLLYATVGCGWWGVQGEASGRMLSWARPSVFPSPERFISLKGFVVLRLPPKISCVHLCPGIGHCNLRGRWVLLCRAVFSLGPWTALQGCAEAGSPYWAQGSAGAINDTMCPSGPGIEQAHRKRVELPFPHNFRGDNGGLE